MLLEYELKFPAFLLHWKFIFEKWVLNDLSESKNNKINNKIN